VLALFPLVLRAQQPIPDPSQPIERRVDDLIPRLTLEEKAALLCTTAPAIERLKIPVMNGWNQACGVSGCPQPCFR
jgi:beta-glucosidase